MNVKNIAVGLVCHNQINYKYVDITVYNVEMRLMRYTAKVRESHTQGPPNPTGVVRCLVVNRNLL